MKTTLAALVLAQIMRAPVWAQASSRPTDFETTADQAIRAWSFAADAGPCEQNRNLDFDSEEKQPRGFFFSHSKDGSEEAAQILDGLHYRGCETDASRERAVRTYGPGYYYLQIETQKGSSRSSVSIVQKDPSGTVTIVRFGEKDNAAILNKAGLDLGDASIEHATGDPKAPRVRYTGKVKIKATALSQDQQGACP